MLALSLLRCRWSSVLLLVTTQNMISPELRSAMESVIGTAHRFKLWIWRCRCQEAWSSYSLASTYTEVCMEAFSQSAD